MNVVVNATPLIALSLVGQLSLLREMFDAVIVPHAVYEEVVTDGYGQPGAAAQVTSVSSLPSSGWTLNLPALLLF